MMGFLMQKVISTDIYTVIKKRGLIQLRITLVNANSVDDIIK